MLTRSKCTRMDDQRKDHIDPERSPQRNPPKQLLTNNVPACDCKNTNGTSKGRDLLLVNKLQTLHQGTERIRQVDQRRKRITVH